MNYIVNPRLSYILKEKGMTQMQLSELTGINQAVISRFDRNRQHMDLHLILISKALNVPIEDLFIIREIED
ncbi:helix-turn-helix transcriptional regulator [Fictibacillus nanhaiensis]|uniref:helix-turn-helix domain-containing protein n=1 Tax=Fictibacillus nanhaiensis TaxID=742169 RepID=UPI002E2221EB|nr:helix-turn-helix transcriptional regulator [Fictibacillus nanhaiensis]